MVKTGFNGSGYGISISIGDDDVPWVSMAGIEGDASFSVYRIFADQ
jgi:hypothetical protein